jgi:hypothetical protein
MRLYLTLLLFTLCTGVFGQSNFIQIIKNAKVSSLPYSSESEQSRQWFINSEKQTKLHLSDSVFVATKLKSIPQTIVNPKGGTSFGDMDCPDSSESRLAGFGAIAIMYVIKSTTDKSYLVHIEVEESGMYPLWHGILACVTPQGEIKSWIYSDGSANGGNPHGNISREFKILPNNIIKISEGAWGDNTETYGFNATYQVVGSKFVLKKRRLLIGRKE